MHTLSNEDPPWVTTPPTRNPPKNVLDLQRRTERMDQRTRGGLDPWTHGSPYARASLLYDHASRVDRVKTMTQQDGTTVAATTRTVEDLLHDGFRLYDVTSTNEHLLLLLEREDKGLRIHLPASQVEHLLATDLPDRLAQSATEPPTPTMPPLNA